MLIYSHKSKHGGKIIIPTYINMLQKSGMLAVRFIEV